MKYRPLDVNGDYTVNRPFLADSPACVAQAVLTRLQLWQGEWFVDSTDGTPYNQQILGKPNNASQDAVIKQRILATPGVTSIMSYSSRYDAKARALNITARIDTQFGAASINASV